MYIGTEYNGHKVAEEKLENNILYVKVNGNDKWFTYSQFLEGCKPDPREIYVNTYVSTKYGRMLITSIDGSRAAVEFDNGYKTVCSVNNAIQGQVKNFLWPTVHGLGYPGVGLYNSIDHKDIQSCWASMLYRVKHSNIKVCKDWLNFQEFAAWYEAERQKRDDLSVKLVLDKDIYQMKLYSPETALLVPVIVNNAFTEQKMTKIKPLPVGVTSHKGGKFKSTIIFNGTKKTYGPFTNPIEAHLVYRREKALIWMSLIESHKSYLCHRAIQQISLRANSVLEE